MYTLIHNIGTLVSGDIENPILEDDAVLINGKLIEKVGSYAKLKHHNIDVDVDIQGMTLCPGLIDTHVHPVLVDWSPRTGTVGWMEYTLHSGVTSLISAGEATSPGIPHDASTAKALAILAKKVYDNFHPGGIKAHCGTLMLEEGLTKEDIKELANEGVWLFAEIGFGNLQDFNKVDALVREARKYGFKIPVHFGPESLPGVTGLSVDEIIKLNPDVVSHLNGGTTSMPFSEMKKVIENSPCFLELVTIGSFKAIKQAIGLLQERNEFNRIIFGTDCPGGSGIEFTGIIFLIARISSLFDIPAATVIAMATGNSARAFGLNTGMVKPGRAADLIVLDAPWGSQGKTCLEALEVGDRPALGMVMVNGKVVIRTTARCFPTKKKVLVNGKEDTTKYADVQFR